MVPVQPGIHAAEFPYSREGSKGLSLIEHSSMSWFICSTLMPSFPGQLFPIDRVGLKYWVNHSLHWRVRFWSVLTPLSVWSVFSLGYSSVARGWNPPMTYHRQHTVCFYQAYISVTAVCRLSWLFWYWMHLWLINGPFLSERRFRKTRQQSNMDSRWR